MAASGAGLPPPNPSSHPPACSAAQGASLSQLPPPPPMAQPGSSVRSWGVLRGMCQQPGVKGSHDRIPKNGTQQGRVTSEGTVKP